MNKVFNNRLSRLNSDQIKAVNTINWPVLVIAGPWTWKTEIIAMRIANILLKAWDVLPNNILALTFTDSGVYAIKQRLLEIIWVDSYQVSVHTFHSFCNEVIWSFTEKFLFARNLSQIDDFEKIQILKWIIDNWKYNHLTTFWNKYYYVPYIIKAISDLKREDVSVKWFEDLIENESNNFKSGLTYNKKTWVRLKKWDKLEKNIFKLLELLDVYSKYQETIKIDWKYDFEDMILFVVNKFKSDSDLLAFFQEKYQYILIDEYQDTNSAQNEIVMLLTSYAFEQSPNVFAVWDDDQSIYRFQWACVENILFFEQHFKDLEKIVLKQNYRSTQEILDWSYSLIGHGIVRLENFDSNIEKSLKSNSGVWDKILLNESENDQEEKVFILKEIKSLLSTWAKLDEIAIFLRSNAEVEQVASFLIKNKIDVNFSWGENVLISKFVQIIIDYLKIIDNPFNDEALYYTMSLPFTWIGQIDLYKISNHLSNINHSLKWPKHYFDIITNDEVLDKLDLSKREKIDDFVALIEQFKIILAKETFYKFFEFFLKKSWVLDFVMSEWSISALNKINTLFNKIKSFNQIDQNLKIKGFLEIIDTFQQFWIKIGETWFETALSWVNIMTAHKSKGLEFNYCFILSCVDKKWGNRRSFDKIKLPMFPSFDDKKSINTNDFLELSSAKLLNEEERRLFFVAITRSKKRCYISFSKKIISEISEKQVVPSQFISEIWLDNFKKCNFVLNIEDQENYFMNNFSPISNIDNASEEEYLKLWLIDFKLSFTSFSVYLDCPLRFKNKYLLKIPEAKNKAMVLWTAFHKALERYFLHFKNNWDLLSYKAICDFFDAALLKEVLTIDESNEIKEIWYEWLKWYLEEYKQDFEKPLWVELSFYARNVRLDDAILTWKIDKIELINDWSNWILKSVRVIDYKTWRIKSENEVLWNTATSDWKIKKQLVFYKILTSLDHDFSSKYVMKEWEIDFVEWRDWKYKKIRIWIESDEVDEMKMQIVDVYKSIQNLKFDWCWKQTCECCAKIS